jgi:trehalose 6-phosphate synthase/phosphatase
VAKEFLASRVDDDGVLILSEFAGAAAELGEAVVVNPYDVDSVADAIRGALQMPEEERHRRMRPMRRRVIEHDVHAWAQAFMDQLERTELEEPRPAPLEPALTAAFAKARPACPLRLLLDYDGTLVPLAPAPDLAIPDADLLELLQALTADERIRVEIVSGRPRDRLEGWFGTLPVVLWAEHGFWRRAPGEDAWTAASVVDARWLDRVSPILEQFTASTPGSMIELKAASVAWHYRATPREFGERQAHELRMLLGEALSNQPLEVLEGKKVVEVRFRGISKAVVARPRHGEAQLDGPIVAFGDDRTDEDLFSALPESSVTVAVGQRLGGARYYLEDYRAVRRLLRGLQAPDAPAHPHFAARSRFGDDR